MLSLYFVVSCCALLFVDPQELRPELMTELAHNNSLNSKAFLIEHGDLPLEFVGNRTECALLVLTKKWGIDYKRVGIAGCLLVCLWRCWLKTILMLLSEYMLPCLCTSMAVASHPP